MTRSAGSGTRNARVLERTSAPTAGAMARSEIEFTGLGSSIAYAGSYGPLAGIPAPVTYHHQCLLGDTRIRNSSTEPSAGPVATLCRYLSRSASRYLRLGQRPNAARIDLPGSAALRRPPARRSLRRRSRAMPRLLHDECRNAMLSLRRDDRSFGPDARPRAFRRRNRADARIPPALSEDRIPRRPPRGFSSADLTGRDLAALGPRGIKMDCALV